MANFRAIMLNHLVIGDDAKSQVFLYSSLDGALFCPNARGFLRDFLTSHTIHNRYACECYSSLGESVRFAGR
jgi:hypothetical protein